MIQKLNKYIRMKECNSIHFEYGGFMHCHVGCPSRYSDVMLNCLVSPCRSVMAYAEYIYMYIYISLRIFHTHIYTHTVYTADTLYLQNVHTPAPSSRGALHGSVTGCDFSPSLKDLTGTTLPPPNKLHGLRKLRPAIVFVCFFSDGWSHWKDVHFPEKLTFWNPEN